MKLDPVERAAFVDHLIRRVIYQPDLEGESLPRPRGNLTNCHTCSHPIDPSQPIRTDVGDASSGQIVDKIEDPSASATSTGNHDRDAVIG